MTRRLSALLALFALGLWMCPGCSPGLPQNGKKDEHSGDKGSSASSLSKDTLPAPPVGFGAAADIAVRDRSNIFEQINGGSVSFLDNGMIDALFATYPTTGGEGGGIDVEVYRFEAPDGAKTQFEKMQGVAGTPWDGGSQAVVHEYGVELVVSTYVIKATFNDGPGPLMAAASQRIARQLVGRLTSK